MTAEKLQERWDAMFQQSESLNDFRYRLPTNAKRAGLIGTFTYAENVRWNKRLLVQLHRAGLLELLDVSHRKIEAGNDEFEEWAEVRVKFPPHAPDLGARASEMRNREVLNFRRGFDQLDELLGAKKCARADRDKSFMVWLRSSGHVVAARIVGEEVCRRNHARPCRLLSQADLKITASLSQTGQIHSKMLKRAIFSRFSIY